MSAAFLHTCSWEMHQYDYDACIEGCFMILDTHWLLSVIAVIETWEHFFDSVDLLTKLFERRRIYISIGEHPASQDMR